MSELATVEPTNGESRAPTPMEMYANAVQQGAESSTLRELMELHKDWEAREARKAYIIAMGEARKEFTPILKKHSGYKGRYKYETLDDIIEAVGPSLARHGFTYDWETEALDDGKCKVTCVITHERGHEKRNSLAGNPEGVASPDANMNEFQRVGGAVTYLMRITFKAALGVAAGPDTDAGGGADSGGKTIMQWAQPWLDRIDTEKGDNWAKSIKADFAKATKEEKWPQQAIALVQGAFAARLKREKELRNA